MDFEIKNEENKPLLGRRDILARIAYEGTTPSRKELVDEVAKRLKTKQEQIVITKVLPEPGNPSAKVQIKVYNDQQTIKALENKFTLKRHGLLEEKKPETKSE